MAGYRVTICQFCGAGYADDIPSQVEFDRYYAEMSKYEHEYHDGKVSSVDIARFGEIVDLAAPYVKTGDRIVDIGCATGGLLAEFKRRGFTNLRGYDPSVVCCETAKRLYEIDVVRSTLSGLAAHNESADLVIMTGVLEHLVDVDTSLRQMRGMIASPGMIYLEVPDASRFDEWFSAPYQFFSMEHVNFFSPQSLANLMARHGFSAIFVQRVNRFIGPKSVEPAIAGLFKINSGLLEMIKDLETSPHLRNYINKSAKMEKLVSEKISFLTRSRTPLAVWGVGTHTLRLLETSELKNANIVSFLDSNSRYHGKSLHGITIEDPRKFCRSDATILISSHMAQEDIKNSIEHKIGLKNPTVCLYNGSPIESAI